MNDNKKFLLLLLIGLPGGIRAMQAQQQEGKKEKAAVAMQVEQPVQSNLENKRGGEEKSVAEKYITATIESSFFVPQMQFSLNAVCPLAKLPFGELAKKQHEERVPYLLVQVITQNLDRQSGDGMEVHYFDAHAFNRHYFGGAQHEYPLLLSSMGHYVSNNEALLKVEENSDFEYKNIFYENIVNKMPLTSLGIHYFQLSPAASLVATSMSLSEMPKFTYVCSHHDVCLGNDKLKWQRVFEKNQLEDKTLHDDVYAQANRVYNLGHDHPSYSMQALRLYAEVVEKSTNPYAKAAAQCAMWEIYVSQNKYISADGTVVPMSNAERGVKLFQALSAIDVRYLKSHVRVHTLGALGDMYKFGKGTAQDMSAAVKYYTAINFDECCAEVCCAEVLDGVQFELGYIYFCNENNQEAIKLLSAVSGRNTISSERLIQCRYALGIMYYNGGDVKSTYEALSIFESKPEYLDLFGDGKKEYAAQIFHVLGNIYFDRAGSENYEKAFDYYQKVRENYSESSWSRRANPEVPYHVARLYDLGLRGDVLPDQMLALLHTIDVPRLFVSEQDYWTLMKQGALFQIEIKNNSQSRGDVAKCIAIKDQLLALARSTNAQVRARSLLFLSQMYAFPAPGIASNPKQAHAYLEAIKLEDLERLSDREEYQYMLGYFYTGWCGIEPQYEKAFALLSASYQIKPRAFAAYAIGKMYLVGSGVVGNYGLAYQWLSKVDVNQLAMLYRDDFNLSKQNAQLLHAEMLYAKQHAADDAQLYMLLNTLDIDTLPDPYQKARVKYMLSDLYYVGRGVEKDIALAHGLLLEVFECSNYLSARHQAAVRCRLGLLHCGFAGDKIAQDEQAALKYLSGLDFARLELAEKIDAQLELAYLYICASRNPRDMIKGKELLDSISDQNNPENAQKIKQFYSKVPLDFLLKSIVG